MHICYASDRKRNWGLSTPFGWRLTPLKMTD
jgi:hypothetical protein